MAAPMVIVWRLSDGAGQPAKLFEGKRFFILQKVPARSQLIAQIESNGGKIVKLEGQEDYKIADHARKDNPQGCISWLFVNDAISRAEIPELDKYRLGNTAGSLRPVGSTAVCARSTRTPFTAEEDRILYRYVKKREKEGARVAGNVIYKEFADDHPSHTFQSWRDRYLKRLERDPPLQEKVDEPVPEQSQEKVDETIPEQSQEKVDEIVSEQSQGDEPEFTDVERSEILAAVLSKTPKDSKHKAFAAGEVSKLLLETGFLGHIDSDRWDAAWETWAAAYSRHAAQDWMNFYSRYLLPECQLRRSRKSMVKGHVSLERSEIGNGHQQNTAQFQASPQRDAIHAVQHQPSVQEHKRKIDSTPVTSPSKRIRAESVVKLEEPVRSRSPAVHQRSTPRRTSPLRQNETSEQQIEENITLRVPRLQMPALEVAVANSSNPPSLVKSRHGAILSQTSHHDRRPGSVDRETIQPSQERTQWIFESALHKKSVDSPSSSPAKPSLTKSDKLTEANLASQQAQHQANPLSGSDVEIGDEEQDQIKRAKWLRQTKHATAPSRTYEAQRDDKADSHGTGQLFEEKHIAETDHTTSARQSTPLRMLDAIGSVPHEEPPSLPESSQQEIEESLDAAVQPPNSPPPKPRQTRLAKGSSETSQRMPSEESQLGRNDMDHDSSEACSSTQDKDSSHDIFETAAEQQVFDEASNKNRTITLGGFTQGGSGYTSSERTSLVFDDDSEDFPIDLSIPSPPLDSDVESDQDDDGEFQHVSQDRSESRMQHEAQNLTDSVSVSSRGVSHSARQGQYENAQRPDRTAKSKRTITGLDTQAILDTETPQFDFDMIPPDSDDAGYPDLSGLTRRSSISFSLSDGEYDLIRPPRASSFDTSMPQNPEPQFSVPSTTPLDDGDSFEAFSKKMIARGYDQASIDRALRTTMMRPDLAEYVLILRKQDQPIPDDIPGIWTEQDDEIIMGSSGEDMEPVQEKHGWQGIVTRLKFLRQLETDSQ